MSRRLCLFLLLASAPLLADGDDYFQSTLCSPPVAALTVSNAEPNRRYHTQFYPQGWAGELRSEHVSPSGKITERWKASEQVPAQRQIVITGTDGLKPFTWDSLDAAQQAALNRASTGVVDGFGAARVSVLRGEACAGGDGCATLHPRRPALGDIVNARPVVVASPDRLTHVMESYDGPPGAYAAFKARPRRAQLYIGANDGMLHAFDAATGEERLAIIPSAVLNKLPALTAPTYGAEGGLPHRFFVDGPAVVQDVYYAQAWHTVLLATFGAGGRGLLALDVTDPDHISLLWEFSAHEDENLGYLLTAPTIARLHSGQWAAVLGNGMDAAENVAALLILDIQTGAVIRRLPTAQPAPGLAMPLVADTNGDGNADYAYAGDSLGNLWRFDLYDHRAGTLDKSPPKSPLDPQQFRLSFGGRPLFRASLKEGNQAPQPITLAPTLISHPTETGYLIVVGTGQNHLADDPDQQSVYGIWDRFTQGQNAHTATTVNAGQLLEQRFEVGGSVRLSRRPIDWYTAQRNPGGKLGWYIDLQPMSPSTGAERVVETPKKIGDTLFIRTRVPSNAPCLGDVERRLYAIDPAVGGRTAFNVFDLNGDSLIDEQDGREGLPPSAITAPVDAVITPDPLTGMPCLLGNDGCTALSLGPRANGRQSWRVVTDAAP
jgi:type IV pilus assembly protein PilY1